jgi:hypothetical protein
MRMCSARSAVPVVLEAVSLGPSRGKRQDRIQSIKSLDRCFLVDAKDRSMLGRFEVKRNNVRSLLFEVRVVREHVTLDAMGFESSPRPHSCHEHVAHSQDLRQFSGAPMRGAVHGLSARPIQNPRFHPGRPRLDLTSSMARVNARQSLSKKSVLPPCDVRAAATQSLLDRAVALTVIQHQDQPRPTHVVGTKGTRAHARLQLSPLRRRNGNRGGLWHSAW